MASGSEGQTTAPVEQEETTAKDEEERTDSTNGEERTEEDSGDQEEGMASGRSMALAIEDVSSLPGETVSDQDGRKIGEVKEIYAVGEDQAPMWVTIESSTGLGRSRMVFVPLARIKNQNDEIRVPYSFDHIHDSPEVEPEDEVSEEDDRALRAYYAIGLADQEVVGSARSYASQVPDGEGEARKIDADAAKGPARELDDTPPAKRVAEAYEKQKEEEGESHRKGRDATAEDIYEEDGADDDKGDDEDDSEG
jgi:sporulation protein YlmC with PRC-barrel domain